MKWWKRLTATASYFFQRRWWRLIAKTRAEYYRLAAERGVTLAMMSLGNLLQEGKGVFQNKTEAYQWFQKAADKGDEKAKAKLVEWSEVTQTPNSI